MGSKKRGSDSIEEEVVALESDKVVEKPDLKKKKLKKEKKIDEGSNNGDEKEEIPMEKKKKRKMMDKERRRVEAVANESKPALKVVKKGVNVEEDGGGMSVGSGSDQPVFHIDVFGDLASGNAAKREAAAERLAVELKDVQRAFENVENKEDDDDGGLKLEAEKDDGLDNCAESVRYAVRRLVRGVSSSRECARQGFASGLAILLTTNLKIKLDSVLKLVDDLLEVTSSMKGQEARDILLGRLFAYGALAVSGRLKDEWTSNRNTPLIKEFASLLISLASKKRYLQEPAAAVLWDLIETLPKDAVASHILDAPGVREWFNGATDPGNPDALLLALKIREKIATDSNFGPLLPRPFSSRKFFTVEHLTSIANCLKESTFCQPRVHGIWPLLVNMLLPDTVLLDANVSSTLSSTKKHKKSRKSSSSDEDSEGNLKTFIEVVLEESLLTGSHDRKHLVFDVLLLIFPRLPASHVPIGLSLKFVHCLMDVLSTKDSWLHKVANHFLMNLSDWVGSDDIRRAFVIMALQKHSGGRFDGVTRTKTVKDLMAGFTTESGCMVFLQKLTSIFIDEDPISDEPSDENQTMDEDSEIVSVQVNGSVDRSSKSDLLKSWVVESLPGLLKYVTLDREAKVKVQKEVMKFLAVQGLFSATLGTEVTSFELEETFRWPKTPISSALSKKCVDQLQLLLSNAEKDDSSHALTNGLETNDLGCYFMRFLGTFCTIPSVSLVRSLSNEDEKAFKALLDMESRLSREERNCGLNNAGADKVHALRYLLIQLLLQLLLRPGEFTEAASELIICCQKAFPVNDDPEPSFENESEDGESPKLMDVLVDTLLSILPQSSAPLRSAVEQVFRCFCKDITDDGLLRMLRVIKKALKPPRHADDGSDEEDDDDILDIEETEESDEAQESEAQADKSDEEVSDGDEDDDNDNDNDDVNDDDDDDDEDEDMDDEAMFKFDALLAKIFQQRKSMAAGVGSTHAQLVVFKLRVLSLVEIYLHKNPDSTRVLTVYSNLVQSFVNPSTTEGSEQLVQRIWGILQKKIFKAKDCPKGEDVQLSTLETLLEKSLRLASRPFKKKRSITKAPQKKQTFSRNRYKMISSLAQQSTHWILKIIDGRKFPIADLTKVLDIFKDSIEKYFNSKKSQLKPEFLKEVIKRRPWVGQHLFGFFLEKCGDAKSDYRRVEALGLIQELFKSVLGQNNPDASKKILKPRLSKLSHLVHQLAVHMPEKQVRRAEVRKFSGKLFQILSTHKLAKSFLNTLKSDAHAVCETQFGEAFLALKKTDN